MKESGKIDHYGVILGSPRPKLKAPDKTTGRAVTERRGTRMARYVTLALVVTTPISRDDESNVRTFE
jgi:hypothetical protein